MKINTKPNKKQLEKIQNKLESENDAGIFDIYSSCDASYFVAEKNSKDIGVICLSIDEDFAEIHKLYIIPEFRRKGFASELVKNTLVILRDRNVKEVGVEIVGESICFWESFLSNVKNIKIDCDKYTIVI